MRCLLVTVIVITSCLHGLSQVTEPAVDYFVQDTIALQFTEIKCNRFCEQSKKRIEKLMVRIQGANNRYLRLFMKEEDALLHSLCDRQVMPALSADPSKLTSFVPKEETFSASRIPEENCKLKNDDSHLVDRQKSEKIANAMMMDAWFDFNRFENICQREGDKESGKSFAELDSVTSAINYVEQLADRPSSMGENESSICKTHLKNLDEAKANLKDEMRRTELIKQYINERQQILAQAFANVPGSGAMLLPIKKCNYYFSEQILEYKKLFKDRSFIERTVFKTLGKLPGFNQMVDTKTFVPSVEQIQLSPELKLSDIMANAPRETQETMTLLQSPGGMNGVMLKEGVKKVLCNIGEISAETKEIKTQLDQLEQAMKEIPEMSKDSTLLQEESPKSQAEPPSTNEKSNSNEDKWSPNPLKTKRVIDRFNYGANIQLDQRNKFFPTCGTLATNISYRYCKNGSIGLGGSMILGMHGKPKLASEGPSNGMSMTKSGCGLRSFVDYGLNKSLFVQCGYETNYRPAELSPASSNVSGSSVSSTVKKSLLVGLKIKYPVKNKLSKPTLEMLYDIFYRQTGQPPFVIRMGIELNRKHGLK